MKHIAHLLTTANLLTNQNEFGNGIVPEAEASGGTSGIRCSRQAGHRLRGAGNQIENTKEGLDAAQSILTTNG